MDQRPLQLLVEPFYQEPTVNGTHIRTLTGNQELDMGESASLPLLCKRPKRIQKRIHSLPGFDAEKGKGGGKFRETGKGRVRLLCRERERGLRVFGGQPFLRVLQRRLEPLLKVYQISSWPVCTEELAKQPCEEMGINQRKSLRMRDKRTVRAILQEHFDLQRAMEQFPDSGDLQPPLRSSVYCPRPMRREKCCEIS